MTDDGTVLGVAGLAIGFRHDEGADRFRLAPSTRGFLVEAPADTILRYHRGPEPPILPGAAVDTFDSGSLWRMRRASGRTVIELRADARGPGPYRVAILEDDLGRGDVWDRDDGTGDASPVDPFEYPLAELLTICLLARRGGLLVHAAGLDDGGRGLLFCGNSTHGKTTMSRLWENEGRLLNDDRIVLRRRGDRLVMYGTPWHGDNTVVSPEGVPLEGLFFLKRSSTHSLRRVEGAEAAAMLLARAFPPFWDPEGLQRTLAFCGEVVGETPCHELGFSPERSVVDFVRRAPRD